MPIPFLQVQLTFCEAELMPLVVRIELGDRRPRASSEYSESWVARCWWWKRAPIHPASDGCCRWRATTWSWRTPVASRWSARV